MLTIVHNMNKLSRVYMFVYCIFCGCGNENRSSMFIQVGLSLFHSHTDLFTHPLAAGDNTSFTNHDLCNVMRMLDAYGCIRFNITSPMVPTCGAGSALLSEIS